MPFRTLSALMLSLALLAPAAHAERLKDLASIAGVRQNQLSGYGIVVGLDGTGDQTTQTPFTVQSIVAMLQSKGVILPPGTSLQLKNVAAVMVTTSLPAFAQPGQTLDITVSSIGNAKSLRGGTLLMTPLQGADGQVYGMAQGNVLVGGVGVQAQGGGAQVQINHLAVGKISAGATVERAVASTLGQDNQIRLELNQTDFTTASRVVEAINDKFGPGIATALDGRVIRVRTPSSSDQRVSFLGLLEGIDVSPAMAAAKVIMNARTGSVVMNQAVALGKLRDLARQPDRDDQPGHAGEPAECAVERQNRGHAERLGGNQEGSGQGAARKRRREPAGRGQGDELDRRFATRLAGNLASTESCRLAARRPRNHLRGTP